MTPDEFVKEFKELKSEIESGYFSANTEISRIDKLKTSGLSDVQIELVKSIVSDALTDTLYTVLLGLDGCASIGKHQMMYQLSDEDGNQLSGGIESYAWEHFQESSS